MGDGGGACIAVLLFGRGSDADFAAVGRIGGTAGCSRAANNVTNVMMPMQTKHFGRLQVRVLCRCVI